MPDMKFRAAADGPFDRVHVEAGEIRRADLSISAKNAASRISATLIASISPARFSGAGRGSRKSVSLMTAKGRAKVPIKFFFPKALMPFFTPTPPSAWLRRGGGQANMAHAAMSGGGSESGGVQQRAATDGET